jgi:general secretion pathway protein L
MLPPALREGARRPSSRLVVHPEAAPMPTAEQIRKAREVLLQVPERLVIRRTLTLPLAAERNLRTVLGFEMDRYTPFKADAVYFAHAVTARLPAKRVLRLSLAAVPRKAVDPWLDMLRALGARPGLDAGGMRLELEPDRAARSAWTLRALTALAIVLLAVATALPLVRKAERAAELQAEVAQARRQAFLAEAARRELHSVVEEEAGVLRQRELRPSALRILQQLALLLPDGDWLTQFELAGTRVRLRGESPNASALVARIEKSGVFADATFDGSVVRLPGTERERFSVSMSAQGAPP